MDTDALIEALGRETASKRPRSDVVLAGASGCGFAAAAVAFLWAMGTRPDLGSALQTPSFTLKLAAALLLAVTAFPLVAAISRPGARLPKGLLWLAPALLAAGVAAELATYAPAEWAPRLVGRNALVCLTVLPVLAALPLAAILLALRHGAPTRPGLAGALAGVLAGAFGALLYATNCTDDSPLFVLTWYSLAIAIVAALGAALGRKVLRW